MHQSTSFELSSVEIGPVVWAVGDWKKKNGYMHTYIHKKNAHWAYISPQRGDQTGGANVLKFGKDVALDYVIKFVKSKSWSVIWILFGRGVKIPSFPSLVLWLLPLQH